MDIIFLTGSLAGLFTTAAFIPQVIKTHKSKHTKDLSLSMYIVFSTGVFLWLIYGVYTKSVPVMAANLVTLLLSLYLLFLKLRYG